MGCVNPDGSISTVARAVLGSISEGAAVPEVVKAVGMPSYRVRASLRELVLAGLLDELEGRYQVTERGLTALV